MRRSLFIICSLMWEGVARQEDSGLGTLLTEGRHAFGRSATLTEDRWLRLPLDGRIAVLCEGLHRRGDVAAAEPQRGLTQVARRPLPRPYRCSRSCFSNLSTLICSSRSTHHPLVTTCIGGRAGTGRRAGLPARISPRASRWGGDGLGRGMTIVLLDTRWKIVRIRRSDQETVIRTEQKAENPAIDRRCSHLLLVR